jgi:hypothetical protein
VLLVHLVKATLVAPQLVHPHIFHRVQAVVPALQDLSLQAVL